MKKRVIEFILLTVFAVLFLSGCKKNVGTPEDNPVVEEDEESVEPAKDYLYGYSCADLKDPFYMALKDAIGVQAEQNKGQFIVRDAGNDPVKQNEQLMEMIDKGADVVFLTASDPDAVTPALEALDKADIPVILLETQVKERDLAKAFISSDNYNAGKVCGEDLKEKMPDGGKLVIVEDKADQNLSEGISGFEEKIKNMEDEAGIAVIDLDDFKLHNDTYGHSAGDAALITTAKIIKKYIRKTDILIRYGGDEFLLILPSIKKHIFEDKLKLIREKIHDAVVPKYEKMQLSVSIGGAIFREGNIEDAIASADRQMYIAKNYKNMVVTEWDENGKKKEENSASEKLKQQILIVDDSEINREILKEILKEDYRILEAANGEECLEQLERYETGISLVLLDIVMPEMDGFEVLAAMNQNHWIEDIPVIMISSEDSDSYIRRAYEMGVSDYISRPFDAKIVYQRVLNMIKLYAKQRRLIRLVTRQIYEKERNNRMLIGILSQIVEFRNGESGRHVIHINLITQLLLEQLVKKTGKYQLSWEDRLLIATASALHDIGKIGIDEKILNKPGKLTKEEFEIMKTHTLIGAQMLDNLDMYRNEKLLKLAYEICRWHHERYDGKGYPDGLVGEEIPISAQVVSLADVYDALVSERVYKKAFSHEKALEMIQNGECGTFNPLLLQCMTEAQDKLKTMMEVAEKNKKE